MSAPLIDRNGSRGAPTAWVDSAPVLLAALALWLLATLGLRPLLVPDEGRYADVARTMFEGPSPDAWLVPMLNGLPFFHKPPLFYWLDIAAMRVVGVNVFAGRFGSACGAWLMGAALLLALRRWHGHRAAALGLGVLATTPFFFLGAQYANHDMLVGGLIGAAILALARAVDDRSRVDLRWLVIGWVLCALAVLAKGLIGIVLPALVIGPWLLAQRRWRELLKLMHPLGLLAFALVGLPWFVAMQLRYPGFFDYFVMEQHFRRFALSTFNNVHGAWFFIAAMPLLTLPWSLWLPAAVRRAWSGRGATTGLYVWWLVAVLGFFSIPSSKLVGYALPALAPWCALLALAIAEPRGQRWRWVMGGAALVCLALVSAAAWKAPKSHRAAALQLAAGLAPGDRVVMVDEYFYDLPFYADLRAPVIVASRWDDPDLPRHDNWRKELHDAAAFAPARAAALLRPLAPLEALSCGAAATWFVVEPGSAPRVAAVAGAQRVYGDAGTELWRAPARPCP
jgi:4-amino-4-deoxy-L-arabinose transferase-like glycosyltransferase